MREKRGVEQVEHLRKSGDVGRPQIGGENVFRTSDVRSFGSLASVVFWGGGVGSGVEGGIEGSLDGGLESGV
jgi:hypothetical protein